MAMDVKKIVSDCIAAWNAHDPDKILSFWADDGDWTRPEGVYKGKGALKRYLKWMFANSKDVKITICGNGIIAEGNKAFVEQTITFTYMGQKAEFLEIGACEISGDKIKHIRSASDRLLIAKQLAKGWLPKMMVNSMVKQTEKSLR
jgi:uncharacterized protein (TIGR02246 family)